MESIGCRWRDRIPPLLVAQPWYLERTVPPADLPMSSGEHFITCCWKQLCRGYVRLSGVVLPFPDHGAVTEGVRSHHAFSTFVRQRVLSTLWLSVEVCPTSQIRSRGVLAPCQRMPWCLRTGSVLSSEQPVPGEIPQQSVTARPGLPVPHGEHAGGFSKSAFL